MAFKGAVAIARKAVTYPVETPVGASKANGKTERTIPSWQATVRVLRSYFHRLYDKIKQIYVLSASKDMQRQSAFSWHIMSSKRRHQYIHIDTQAHRVRSTHI